jgi:hypothetical protein
MGGMSMIVSKKTILALVGALVFGTAGCQEKHETRKVIIEGPQEKHEIKIEKTEKHHHHDDK